MNSFDLSRFHKAQDYFYGAALREIRRGHKQTHWMWFVFPQLRGLGHSYNATYYGIENLNEAKAYLADPILGARLREISAALTALEGDNPVRVMGPIDAVKLRSSMTLFLAASDGEAIFQKVLDKYFAGERDPATLELLGML